MTINYELGKVRANGSRRVYIIIRNGSGIGSRKHIATSMVVWKDELNRKGEIRNAGKLAEIQAFIAAAYKKMDAAPFALQPEPLKANDIAVSLLGGSGKDFFRWCEKWMRESRLKGIRNYKTAVNSFRKWLQKDSVTFEEMTPALLSDYCRSLDDSPRAQTMYLSALRHLWNEAERYLPDDDVPRSPFRKFRVPKQRFVGQRAVDESIIRKVYEYRAKPGSRAELARDCFLLSFCLIGTNSADLYDCRVLEEGVLKYDRAKTKDRRSDHAHIEIAVHPFIAALVAKYRDSGRAYVFSFHRRYTDHREFNRAINVGLKEIEPDLTFYAARHTWATIARNTLRNSREDVDEALNHKNTSTSLLDIYVKKDFARVNEINRGVIEYVFKEKGDAF